MKKRINSNTLININQSVIGETIEVKVERILNNKNPISDGAPLIYTERNEGVLPDYDIRADRFEYAIDAMDKVTKAKLAKRAEYYAPKKVEIDTPSGE